MSISSSTCLTCLSNQEESSTLTEALTNFLCDVLHFKQELVNEAPIVCRKCYKILIEFKCFYTQLRDVEVYFARNPKTIKTDPDDMKEELEMEPYISEMECSVSIADEDKLEPILINEDEECCIIEDEDEEEPEQQQPTSSANGRRFVCLTCSKLFMTVKELRAHESTHSRQSIPKTLPVFVPAHTQVPATQNLKCTECGQEFNKTLRLEIHMRNHKKDKIRPFCCMYCKRRFQTEVEFLCHESKKSAYQCLFCQMRCCSRTGLEIHMNVAHKSVRKDIKDGDVSKES